MNAELFAALGVTGVAVIAGLIGYAIGKHEGLTRTGDWDSGFEMGRILGRYGAQLRYESELTGIPVDELIRRQAEADRGDL